MTPAHEVWKSKLATLAWLINKAIDNGNYDLPIVDVRSAAKEERVFQYINERLPTLRLVDLSLFTAEDAAAVNERFMQLNGNNDGHVENLGLCLLLAWTIDMLQDAVDPK